MLYREIRAVCSQIHTKHINTQCGQNVELLNVKLEVHIVTTGLYMDKRPNSYHYSKVKILYSVLLNLHMSKMHLSLFSCVLRLNGSLRKPSNWPCMPACPLNTSDRMKGIY
jgi:hypothetical protein